MSEDAELLDFFDHIDIYVQLRGEGWEVRVATQRQSKWGGPNNRYLRGPHLDVLLNEIVPMLRQVRFSNRELGFTREIPFGATEEYFDFLESAAPPSVAGTE